MKSIIFISPPASGKGTISKILEENFNYKHLALGDCLREEVENGNEEVKSLIENGKLVSDKLIMSIIKKRISTLKDSPFIIDGCPRTLNQAQLLSKILEDEKVTNVTVIKLNLNVETAKERILGRLICKCGKSYNIYNTNFKPKVSGVCDKCGQSLNKRSDDTEEKIIIRFKEYENNIEPIVNFYKDQKIVSEIDANGDVDSILEVLKGLLNDKN